MKTKLKQFPKKNLKVVLLGDILLTLYVPGYCRFDQTEWFDIEYTGCEGIVAANLDRLGIGTQIVTRFPENPLGDAAVAQLRKHGIGTDYIVRGGSRIGVCFLEHGAEHRPYNVIYDRIPSAVTEMTPDMFDWKSIFNNCDWFHFSGITPALSKTAARTVQTAVEHAKKRGVCISCDFNFRYKLWTRQQAARVMRPMVRGITCIFGIGNESNTREVFGVGAGSSEVESGSIDPETCRDVLEQMLDKYNIHMGAVTLREIHSAFDNDWSGVFHDGKEFYVSPRYQIKHVVDRYGAGDAFSSAMIFEILTGKNGQEAVNFAAAASCLKHSIPGTLNLTSVEEINDLIKIGGTGGVKR